MLKLIESVIEIDLDSLEGIMEKVENNIKPRYGIVNLERRKYPRFSIDLPIEYYRIDSSRSYAVQTANISEGGLLIYLPEKIEMGQHLKLRLFFASISESLQTMEVLAEVVWEILESGKLAGNYPHGVKFIDANPKEMNRLKDFLRSLSQ